METQGRAEWGRDGGKRRREPTLEVRCETLSLMIKLLSGRGDGGQGQREGRLPSSGKGITKSSQWKGQGTSGKLA